MAAGQESHASPNVPAQAGATMPTRRLALIVHTWGHASSFFAWTFMKQYILRRIEKDGCTMLDPSEQLFIVKAGKDDEGNKWKMGGPLIPDLETAVAHYPCTVVRLEGGAKSSLRAWLEKNAIDILIVGEHWPSNVLKLTSVSEWVKQNVSCPFLIIRSSAVANARMKISSNLGSSASSAPASLGAPGAEVAAQEGYLSRTSPGCPRTAAMTGRRIAITYTSFAMGRGLIQFAKDKVLSRNDTIYICHVFPDKNPVVHQTMRLMRAMTMQKADSFDEVTRDNSIEFGAAELAGYNVHLNVVLQGDPKNALTSFCESEDIELLMIGSRSGGKIRKKLGGGGVSSFLIDHAPCPCLVVPYKHIGIEEGRDTADEEMLGTSPSSPPGWMATALDMVTGAGEGRSASPMSPVAAATADAAAMSGASGHSTPSDLLAQLQRQLVEKDRVIADLHQQVHELQLAAAQREAAATHDAAQANRAI